MPTTGQTVQYGRKRGIIIDVTELGGNIELYVEFTTAAGYEYETIDASLAKVVEP